MNQKILRPLSSEYLPACSMHKAMMRECLALGSGPPWLFQTGGLHWSPIRRDHGTIPPAPSFYCRHTGRASRTDLLTCQWIVFFSSGNQTAARTLSLSSFCVFDVLCASCIKTWMVNCGIPACLQEQEWMQLRSAVQGLQV